MPPAVRTARRSLAPRASHLLALTALAAAIVFLGVAVSGCTPGAYTQVRVERLSVEIPTSWDVRLDDLEEPWAEGYQPEAGGTEQIQLSGDFGDVMSAGQAMGTLVGRAQVGLEGFEVVASDEIEVRGATTAQLTQYTLEDPDGTPYCGTWIVAALWPHPQSIAVSILTDTCDDEVIAHVKDSLALHPVGDGG
ncbi:MAG: hypothetical protein ACRCSL_13235 [Microbacterium sp.]